MKKMKKTTTLIITTLLSIVGFAQTDIATARAQGIGASVTITGVVTNGDELGPILRIIQVDLLCIAHLYQDFKEEMR